MRKEREKVEEGTGANRKVIEGRGSSKEVEELPLFSSL
jgi:hypothetical protein